MEQKELKIDVAAAARQALQERQPGEDLDEALLRSCKKLYGESGATTFQAVQNAVSAIAQRLNVDREKAVQQITEGKASISVVTRTQITRNVSAGSLNDLPPEMRAEVEKALASGKSGEVVVTRTVGGRKGDLSHTLGPQTQTGMSRCENCGFEFPSDTLSCPQCGKSRKRSFWSRLFGK